MQHKKKNIFLKSSISRSNVKLQEVKQSCVILRDAAGDEMFWVKAPGQRLHRALGTKRRLTGFPGISRVRVLGSTTGAPSSGWTS